MRSLLWLLFEEIATAFAAEAGVRLAKKLLYFPPEPKNEGVKTKRRKRKKTFRATASKLR